MEWTLLKNEKAEKSWRKKEYIYWGYSAREYPCFAYCTIDGSEDPCAIYLYKKDIEKMLKKLVSAKEKGR